MPSLATLVNRLPLAIPFPDVARPLLLGLATEAEDTDGEDLSDVASALEGQFGEIEAKSTKLIWKPQNTVPVVGDDAEKLMRLLDVLDDLDDVANIYDNSELSEEEIERLAG